MARSPLFKRLSKRARDVGSRALDEILESESRSDALGSAVRGVQRGRKTMDEQGQRVLGALGLATHEDLERVNRKVGRLRKRMMAILDELDD